MKKLFVMLACVAFLASAVSCAKKCDCTEKNSDGKVIKEYQEKQIKVLSVKMPCSYFDDYTVDGGTITCR